MDNTDGITKPRNQVSNNSTYARDGKILLCSGIILFTVLVVVVCFHGYARWIFKRRLRSRRQRRDHLLSPSVTPAASGVANRALDPSVLETLPTLVYSSKTQETVLQCAVCLSEFEDGEKGRVLPKCEHAFHIDCVDIWFHTHSNCPLCRAPVQSDRVSETCAETVVKLIEETCLQPESRQKREDERGCSASSLPVSLSHVESHWKSCERVSIVVDVPTGTATGDERLGSLVGMGLDSTVNPLPPS